MWITPKPLDCKTVYCYFDWVKRKPTETTVTYQVFAQFHDGREVAQSFNRYDEAFDFYRLQIFRGAGGAEIIDIRGVSIEYYSAACNGMELDS